LLQFNQNTPINNDSFFSLLSYFNIYHQHIQKSYREYPHKIKLFSTNIITILLDLTPISYYNIFYTFKERPMSVHNILGFYIYKTTEYSRGSKTGNPYRWGFVYDRIDEYDPNDSTRLVAIHTARELGVDGFADFDYSGSPDGFSAIKFSENDFQTISGSHNTGFTPAGRPIWMELVTVFKTPYAIPDNDQSEELGNYLRQMDQVVQVLGDELKAHNKETSPTVIYQERLMGGGLTPSYEKPFVSYGLSHRVELDHGSIEVDPNAPIFHPEAGETGQSYNPNAPYEPPTELG
jgi:hypothetical protein